MYIHPHSSTSLLSHLRTSCSGVGSSCILVSTCIISHSGLGALLRDFTWCLRMVFWSSCMFLTMFWCLASTLASLTTCCWRWSESRGEFCWRKNESRDTFHRHPLIGLVGCLFWLVLFFVGRVFCFVLLFFTYKTFSQLTLGSTYDLKLSGTRTASIIMMSAAMGQKKSAIKNRHFHMVWRNIERTLSVGGFTCFTFCFDALAWNFDGISTQYVVSSSPIDLICNHVAITECLIPTVPLHPGLLSSPSLLRPKVYPKGLSSFCLWSKVPGDLFLHAAFLTYRPLCSVTPDPAC